MSPLPSKTFQDMLDQLDLKQEAMKISESMDTPYYQQSDKQHKLLIEIYPKTEGLLRTM